MSDVQRRLVEKGLIAPSPAGAYPETVTPHFRVPFGLSLRGTFSIVDQDSGTEVLQSLRVLILTRRNERVYNSNFGMSEILFEFGNSAFSSAELAEAVARYDPRVTVTEVERVVGDLGDVGLTLEVES